MDKKLNPLDGEIDLLGDTVSDIIRKLNPLTGRLELVYSADSYIQKINPFIGDFDMVGGTGASYIVKEATGNGYINLTNAVANHLMELKAYGGIEQSGTPTPTTPINIISNNGVLKFGKQITLNPTRYYAYITTTDERSYIKNSYSIIIPVTVGQKYRIIADPTTPVNGNIQNTILRRGFVDTVYDDWKTSAELPETMTVPIYDYVRTSPQSAPDSVVTATHPYMVIQMGVGVFADNIANGRILLTEQSIYTDGTTETISSTLSTATAEMLLKIGDYVDEQSIIDGIVTRKIGVKVLDGTENWNIIPTAYADGTHRIYTNNFGYNQNTNAISTHFVEAPLADRDLPTGQQGKMYHSEQSFHLRATQFTSLLAAKQWLSDQYNAGTPVIIVYPLATPTAERVAGQTMNIPAGSSTISITQASIDNLGLYAKYKATE